MVQESRLYGISLNEFSLSLILSAFFFFQSLSLFLCRQSAQAAKAPRLTALIARTEDVCIASHKRVVA